MPCVMAEVDLDATMGGAEAHPEGRWVGLMRVEQPKPCRTRQKAALPVVATNSQVEALVVLLVVLLVQLLAQ
eukprot:Skav212929  [mRNA]  locus=scaffold374:342954:344524:+ [translate_table: standard]